MNHKLVFDIVASLLASVSLTFIIILGVYDFNYDIGKVIYNVLEKQY